MWFSSGIRVHVLFEVRSRACDAFFERDFGLEIKDFSRLFEVGSALSRIVLRERSMFDGDVSSEHASHRLCELEHRELVLGADVDGTDFGGVLHEREEASEEVVDVAEATCLTAVAIHREGLVAQRLHDEVAHDASIVWIHPRAVRIEDAHDAGIDVATAVKVHHEALGGALAFVVASAGADGID